MNCTDVKELLMPYADGELEPEMASAVQAELAHCASCQADFAEIQRVSGFARVAFTAPMANVDLSHIYGRVMAQVAADQRATQPSIWARTATWFRELVRFEHPVALAGMAAAAVAVVVGATALSGGSSPSTPAGNGSGAVLAKSGEEAAPGVKRRDAENEVRAGGRNTAFVEGWEVARGKVFIEQSAEDPDQPLVLWHVVDEDGKPAPKGL